MYLCGFLLLSIYQLLLCTLACTSVVSRQVLQNRAGGHSFNSKCIASASFCCQITQGCPCCCCCQVIKLLHTAFQAAGLGLYLRPYGCLPTGYECGIIEVNSLMMVKSVHLYLLINCCTSDVGSDVCIARQQAGHSYGS
jgi:hypothetical protein